jgi:hypothetical protein
MKLSAPKTITFIVGVVLGVLALIFQYVTALNLSGTLAFWTAIVAVVVLVLGNLIKGL